MSSLSDTSTDEAFAGYLDELERLCNAATPGPWTADVAAMFVFAPTSESVCEFDGEARDDDANFIATARHALPKLIAKVRQLQVRIAKVTALGNEFADDPATALRCIGEHLDLAEHYDRYPNSPRQE